MFSGNLLLDDLSLYCSWTLNIHLCLIIWTLALCQETQSSSPLKLWHRIYNMHCPFDVWEFKKIQKLKISRLQKYPFLIQYLNTTLADPLKLHQNGCNACVNCHLQIYSQMLYGLLLSRSRTVKDISWIHYRVVLTISFTSSAMLPYNCPADLNRSFEKNKPQKWELGTFTWTVLEQIN